MAIYDRLPALTDFLTLISNNARQAKKEFSQWKVGDLSSELGEAMRNYLLQYAQSPMATEGYFPERYYDRTQPPPIPPKDTVSEEDKKSAQETQKQVFAPVKPSGTNSTVNKSSSITNPTDSQSWANKPVVPSVAYNMENEKTYLKPYMNKEVLNNIQSGLEYLKGIESKSGLGPGSILPSKNLEDFLGNITSQMNDIPYFAELGKSQFLPSNWEKLSKAERAQQLGTKQSVNKEETYIQGGFSRGGGGSSNTYSSGRSSPPPTVKDISITSEGSPVLGLNGTNTNGSIKVFSPTTVKWIIDGTEYAILNGKNAQDAYNALLKFKKANNDTLDPNRVKKEKIEGNVTFKGNEFYTGVAMLTQIDPNPSMISFREGPADSGFDMMTKAEDTFLYYLSRIKETYAQNSSFSAQQQEWVNKATRPEDLPYDIQSISSYLSHDPLMKTILSVWNSDSNNVPDQNNKLEIKDYKYDKNNLVLQPAFKTNESTSTTETKTVPSVKVLWDYYVSQRSRQQPKSK